MHARKLRRLPPAMMMAAVAISAALWGLGAGCKGPCAGQDESPTFQVVLEKSFAVNGGNQAPASRCIPSDSGVPHVVAAQGATVVETGTAVVSTKRADACPSSGDPSYYCSHEDEESRRPGSMIGTPSCLSVEGDDPPVHLDSAEYVGPENAANGYRLTFTVLHAGTVKLVDAKQCAPAYAAGADFIVDVP